MSGPSASLAEVAELITSVLPDALVTVGDEPLSLPNRIDGSGIDQLLDDTSQHRPLLDGIAHSIAEFSRLIDAGLVEVPDADDI
jgi:hypothetical protein